MHFHYEVLLSSFILSPLYIILKDGGTLVSGSFMDYMGLPDAEPLSQDEHDSNQRIADDADGQMSERKRNKSTEVTEEQEEPCPSPFSYYNQKKPAKKPSFSMFGYRLCYLAHLALVIDYSTTELLLCC